ncbi:MAG TPA: hypothetical protein DCQ31_11435 [Bacteroidales bacterium]|nr:hypothetical protein [Bacteroidales bacterium]
MLASCKTKFPSKYLTQIENAQFAIKKMSKRCGSCASNGQITLNTELIKAPKGSSNM